MLSDRQIELITDRAIREFIHGYRTTEGEYRLPAVIPSVYALQKAVSAKLNNIKLGSPTFPALHMGELSSASIFNTNLVALVDDISIYINELISQIYTLNRHFSATEYEFRKIENRLQRLKFDVDGLLLVTRNALGYLYSVGDNFQDRIYIDDARTTAAVNTKGAFVEIPDISTYKHVISHYDRSPDNLRILTKSTGSTYLGTKFIHCLDDIEDSYFMISVSSTVDNGLSLEFSVKLDKNGKPVPITEISMSGNGSYMAGLSYKNYYTSDWTPLSDSRLVERLTKYSIRPYALENTGDDINPGITEVKFTLSKGTPDRVSDGLFEYDFMLNNLSFNITGSTRKASLYSASLGFEEFDGRTFTVNQVSLSVDEDVPDGTRIDYYIAIDPYAEGTLLDSNGDPVGSDSNDIDDYEDNGDYPGADGVLYSTLKDNSISTWSNWTPSWMPVTPIERTTTMANISGGLAPKLLPLNNYDVVDETTTGWDFTQLDSVNGIDFYRIYDFESDPRDVELRQGRHAWIRTIDYSDRELVMESDGQFIEDSYDHFLYIGTDYVPGTGYMVSPGNVVPGSVSSIVWKNRDPNDPSSKLLLTDNLPMYVADAHIEYSAGTATITKNRAAVWNTPNLQVKVTYSYYAPEGKLKYETNMYVPNGSTPYIIVSDVSKVDSIVVENIDSEGRNIIYTGDKLRADTRVSLSYGWNRVIIYTHAGTTWDPVTYVTIPASLEYYAYMEPLTRVGVRSLFYNTHRNDHTRMSIYESDSTYYACVNNPAATATGVSMSYYHASLGTGISAADIFADGDSVNAFYDLSYSLIAREVTNVLLRAEFSGDGVVTPRLYSYRIMGGDYLHA